MVGAAGAANYETQTSWILQFLRSGGESRDAGDVDGSRSREPLRDVATHSRRLGTRSAALDQDCSEKTGCQEKAGCHIRLGSFMLHPHLVFSGSAARNPAPNELAQVPADSWLVKKSIGS